jgi:GTP-binding protein
MFVHLLDGTRPDPVRDMEVINGELAQFRKELAAKPQIVAVNKIDLPAVADRTAELGELLAAKQIEPFFVSAATGQGVGRLLQRIAQELSTLMEEVQLPSPLPVLRPQPLRGRFSLSVCNGVYSLSGERLEAFAEMMPLEQEEGRAEFWRRLSRWGVVAALRRAGIQPGAKVCLGQVEVEWEG